jgi:hypothetical protein
MPTGTLVQSLLVAASLGAATAVNAESVTRLLGDMTAPGEWVAFQWNKAKCAVALSDDIPEALRGQVTPEKSLAMTISWPAGGGFAFSKIDPGDKAKYATPYRMSMVSLWVKGTSGHVLEVHFEHEGKQKTADGKELKVSLGKLAFGEWQRLDAAIPADWPQPLAINSIAQHNYGVQASGEAVTRFARMEAVIDPSVDLVEQARLEREAKKAEALRLARELALQRPQVDLKPFGRLSLVDEVDCAGDGAAHEFLESAKGASRVETILGRRTRILPTQEGEASYLSWRLGKGKGLRAGAAYVIAIDYPEDEPRTMIVINRANGAIRGFHTGLALGDAMHPKYVNNHLESLDTPLSGDWETWSLLVHLQDRFPGINPEKGKKTLVHVPADGFHVIVSQYAQKNEPMSRGLAVSRIRLLEVVDEDRLAQKLVLPPEGLPRRHISWREEMSDGVIQGATSEERGIEDRLDWYRQKAAQMRFLGMNTFTKDLLEFGACQHWDSSEYGGNDWVYFDGNNAYLWAEIVALMASHGFDILPYYEYAGSKGKNGLGNQKRCLPLTRDDAYTHIHWIENANADVTDPDTYADFAKMLDLTVLRFKDVANFAGIWLRPRQQMPIGFGPATLKRFADEANGGAEVTRELLRGDQALYGRYLDWWGDKRRDFLVAMRQHLIDGGIADPLVLFTGVLAESGVGLEPYGPILVTDRPDAWGPILARPEHRRQDGRETRLASPTEVAADDMYLASLPLPGGTWGGWEWQHSKPADDPQRYKETAGVLLTHTFNRLYTVVSPKTFEAFRGPGGLAVVRHYTLNENMLFDRQDKPIAGYFVADVERAGRLCMQAEVNAMAHGDPTYLGYLVGANFGRGFPGPVREFNANFLALPALPSEILAGACDDPEVTVRRIATPEHGTYLAIMHTGVAAKQAVPIRMPAGDWKIVLNGKTLPVADGVATIPLVPCQLIALHAAP